jgi:hypothetical protein
LFTCLLAMLGLFLGIIDVSLNDNQHEFTYQTELSKKVQSVANDVVRAIVAFVSLIASKLFNLKSSASLSRISTKSSGRTIH